MKIKSCQQCGYDSLLENPQDDSCSKEKQEICSNAFRNLLRQNSKTEIEGLVSTIPRKSGVRRRTRRKSWHCEEKSGSQDNFKDPEDYLLSGLDSKPLLPKDDVGDRLNSQESLDRCLIFGTLKVAQNSIVSNHRPDVNIANEQILMNLAEQYDIYNSNGVTRFQQILDMSLPTYRTPRYACIPAFALSSEKPRTLALKLLRGDPIGMFDKAD
jgi:hypothetical protein